MPRDKNYTVNKEDMERLARKARDGPSACESWTSRRDVNLELMTPESFARFWFNRESAVQRNYSESANARDAPNGTCSNTPTRPASP